MGPRGLPAGAQGEVCECMYVGGVQYFVLLPVCSVRPEITSNIHKFASAAKFLWRNPVGKLEPFRLELVVLQWATVPRIHPKISWLPQGMELPEALTSRKRSTLSLLQYMQG